ncbi:MAG: ABC transporter substrate-binding protein, partial [Myxococcota bacterium]|nr:ABC transporter substrate-binding protein [Myxococcota bacterium]
MSRWCLIPGLVLLASGLGGCSLLLDFDEEGAGVGPVDGSDADTDDADGVMEVPPLFQGTCTELLPADLTEGEALSDDTLLLGAILPLSGELESYGPGMRDGVELAVQEINQSGGIFGLEVAILSCDSATSSDTAIEAAHHLAALGVPAIIGPGGSTITIEAFQSAAHEA